MITIRDTIFSDSVSYQDYAFSKDTKEISIGNFLDSIKNEKYNNEIIKLRKYLSVGDIKRYNQEKIRLPSVTFSGLFTETRKIESLSKYNDICVIDIDKILSQDIIKYLDLLYSDPFVFSFWLSPSGRGIKGLVKFSYISEPIISDSYVCHKYAFSELSNYFKGSYNIEIDKSGSDITRLCFVSSDRNLIIKEQTKEFPIDNQSLFISASINTRRKNDLNTNYFILKNYMNSKGKNKTSTRVEIQKITNFLKKRNLSITSTYENWYRVAYAISNTFTYDLGEKYYLRLCRLDGSRHDEELSKSMLQYCYVNSRNAISFGTVLFYFNKLKEARESRTEEGSSKLDP